MPDALQLFQGDALTGVRRWANLPEDERKRRAMDAASNRSEPELWSLIEAHLTLFGSAGSHVSLHTLRAYRGSLRIYLDAAQGESILHPATSFPALWVRTLEQQGKSASTVSVRLAGVRMLYAALRWACNTDPRRPVVGDPFKDVRPARDPTPAHEKRQPYGDSDVDRLAAAADTTLRALILLAAHGGLRVSECLALRWADIDLTARRLIVQRGKGGKKRSVNLSRRLTEALDDLPRTDPVLWYPSSEQARRELARLCTRTGVKYRGIHAFRHTCGTRIYRETGRLEDSQRALGHSNISTTQIYSAWSDETLKRTMDDW